MCKLYGLFNLYKDSKGCYECFYFQKKPYSQWILDAIKALNKEIRPAALNLIEAFATPDELLLSAIGNSYGDIYETHLEWAQNSRLNKTKDGDAIPDGFLENMMPVLKGKL